MAANVSNAVVLKTLAPTAFRKRLTCDRSQLPADGVDVPIVLDLVGCHAKPRVLASCTSGQELLFSEPIVSMVHQLAEECGAAELRVRFSDRVVAAAADSGANAGAPSLQSMADEIVGALVRSFGKRVVAAALARAK